MSRLITLSLTVEVARSVNIAMLVVNIAKKASQAGKKVLARNRANIFHSLVDVMLNTKKERGREREGNNVSEIYDIINRGALCVLARAARKLSTFWLRFENSRSDFEERTTRGRERKRNRSFLIQSGLKERDWSAKGVPGRARTNVAFPDGGRDGGEWWPLMHAA